LFNVANEAKNRSLWIQQPLWGIRIAVFSLIALIIIGLFLIPTIIEFELATLTFFDVVQVLESAINDVVLIGAALFFLFSVEQRVKRRRTLSALHELRSLAHVIDMHQLTKDPERLLTQWQSTESSPTNTMTAFELNRYLDYCSEMLSLIGKIAALYVQNFDDAVALDAVNEIEALATGLSRKIWQKRIILRRLTDSTENLSQLAK